MAVVTKRCGWMIRCEVTGVCGCSDARSEFENGLRHRSREHLSKDTVLGERRRKRVKSEEVRKSEKWSKRREEVLGESEAWFMQVPEYDQLRLSGLWGSPASSCLSNVLVGEVHASTRIIQVGTTTPPQISRYIMVLRNSGCYITFNVCLTSHFFLYSHILAGFSPFFAQREEGHPAKYTNFDSNTADDVGDAPLQISHPNLHQSHSLSLGS